MSEIKRSGKWNPGGGRWLDIAPAFGVASYARTKPGAVPVITFREGFAWSRIYCTPETLQYRQTTEYTDQGPLYSFEIKGFSASDDAVKAGAIDELFAYEKVLARFCDNNGMVRIIGNPTEALSFTHELATDNQVLGNRGYTLNLKGTSIQRGAYA